MQNKKLIRYVEALVLLPILTMSGSTGEIPASGLDIVKASQVVFSPKLNSEEFALNELSKIEADIKSRKAAAIDRYFKERGMPLYGMGEKFVEEAEKNGLDWRLLAAIAVRESTGGKFECKRVENNAFGWASCRIGFESNAHAIETVGRNLGGNNPKTAHHYAGKTTLQILRAYNPPSIVPRYAEQVINIMNAISDLELADTLTHNPNS